MLISNYVIPLIVVLGIMLLVYLLSRLFWKVLIEAQTPVFTDLTQAQAQAQAHQLQQAKSKGLNQEIIDSYPTVVIKENGQMLHLDDNTCPICLCEYHRNDILKILPECLHKFHCHCLVKWLKLNDTCPVCRTHPPRF